MSLMVVTDANEIRALLPQLKAATIPGRSHDGARLVVNYKAFNEPTERALRESQIARDEGLDLQTYSGILDRVFRNARGELCFTLFVLERTDSDGRHHLYRTMNTVKGEVLRLVVLGENRTNGNGHDGNGHHEKH